MTVAPLVTAEWLKDRLGAPDLRVIDASWFMPGASRDPDAEFLERHIPGAVRFDIEAVADADTPLPHMLPDPAAFARIVGATGVGGDHRIVVYTSEGLAPAARVWWTFRAMGHDAVSVLDGGLPRWIAAGGALEAGAPSHPPARFHPRPREALVQDFDGVVAALARAGDQVLDVRPAPRFRGEAPEPRPGLRSGHMPGALNLPSSEFAAADGTMKPPEALRDLFEGAGAALDRPVIASCGSGVTAALAALALARLGRWDVAVYDGSWSEWGGRDDAPVVTGAA